MGGGRGTEGSAGGVHVDGGVRLSIGGHVAHTAGGGEGGVSESTEGAGISVVDVAEVLRGVTLSE